MMTITSLSFLFAIIVTTFGIAAVSTIDVTLAQSLKEGPECDNYLEREERFLDRYESDPDNNGKQESFQSSFQNGGPCF